MAQGVVGHSSSHTGLYLGIVLAIVILAGAVLFGLYARSRTATG